LKQKAALGGLPSGSTSRPRPSVVCRRPWGWGWASDIVTARRGVVVVVAVVDVVVDEGAVGEAGERYRS
jgi:hypothetical protein